MSSEQKYPYAWTSFLAFTVSTYLISLDSIFISTTSGSRKLIASVFWLVRAFLAAALMGGIFLLLLCAAQIKPVEMSNMRTSLHIMFVAFVSMLCSIQTGIVYSAIKDASNKSRAVTWVRQTSPITLLTGTFFYIVLEVYLRGRMGYEEFESKDAASLKAKREEAASKLARFDAELVQLVEAKERRRVTLQKNAYQNTINDTLRYNFVFDSLFNLRHPHQNGPPGST